MFSLFPKTFLPLDGGVTWVGSTGAISIISSSSSLISITSVATDIDRIGEFSKGLYHKSKQKLSASSLVKEFLGWLAAADNPTPSGRASAYISLNGTGKVQVEYEVLLHRLRLKLFECVVRERHGSDAVRIVRILTDHGKMDEKHVSSTTCRSRCISKEAKAR